MRILLGKQYFHHVLCSFLMKLLILCSLANSAHLYILLDWTDSGYKHQTRHFWNGESLAMAPNQTLVAPKLPVSKGFSKTLSSCPLLHCALEESVTVSKIHIPRLHKRLSWSVEPRHLLSQNSYVIFIQGYGLNVCTPPNSC